MSRLHRRRAANARQDAAISDVILYHRKIRDEWKEWNKKHYSGLRFRKRKTPWYKITSGKQWNFEERTEPYGQAVQYYRVPSEAKRFSVKTCCQRMTHEQYIERLIQAKLDDWVEKHPRPIPYNPKEKDMFESFFMLPWIDEHTKARENIVNFVNNIGTKVHVFARYKGDKGYPRKIMEFHSDHQKLMILDGKYANHLGSKTVRKVQRVADRIGRFDSRLIALKIVDGNQECILIPNPRFKAVA